MIHFFMDQHAAHEKVLFENILRMFKEKTVVAQELATCMWKLTFLHKESI